MKIQSKIILSGVIISSCFFGIRPGFVRKNIALAESNCSDDAFKCLEMALKELEQTKKEIRALEKRLENRVEEAEEKATNVQTTADKAITDAATAQATANDSLNRANAAQATANGAVKGIKSFTVDAVINTRQRENVTNITFPERVDFIALESIANDGNQMSQGRVMKRINDRTFQVRFIGIHPDGHNWIPHLKFTGIQIQK